MLRLLTSDYLQDAGLHGSLVQFNARLERVQMATKLIL